MRKNRSASLVLLAVVLAAAIALPSAASAAAIGANNGRMTIMGSYNSSIKSVNLLQGFSSVVMVQSCTIKTNVSGAAINSIYVYLYDANKRTIGRVDQLRQKGLKTVSLPVIYSGMTYEAKAFSNKTRYYISFSATDTKGSGISTSLYPVDVLKN